MSAYRRISRQTARIQKTRFDVLLWNENYDFLFELAQAEGRTMAATMNEILRRLRHGVPQETAHTQE